MQFTRYLYLKDEVELSLLSSLLNKNEKQALFWVSELYYSGFVKDLIHLLWKIYYDLYASQNFTFSKYLFTKLKPTITIDTLYTVISNLIIRPFNTDILLCKIMSETFDFDFDSDINTYLLNEDYLFISCLILDNNNGNSISSLEEYFQEKGTTIRKQYTMFEKYSLHTGIKLNVILLSYVLYLINKIRNKKIGKNLFVDIDNSYDFKTVNCNLDTDIHSNKPYNAILPAREILRNANLLEIDTYNYLSLFELTRDKIPYKNLDEIYRCNWEYYCFNTPYWNKIMKQYDVELDEVNKTIIFVNDYEETKFDDFYNYYGLDTDEQPIEIRDKCVKTINIKYTWQDIYNKFHGIIEIDKEYIEDINKFKYN